MDRSWIWVGGVGLLLGGFMLGRAGGGPEIEFPDPTEARTASQMEQAVSEALGEVRSFPRSSQLIRLFEGLSPENASGAAAAVAERSGRWDPVDLQLFLGAWVHLDPLSAIREVESWPIKSRREIGITVVMREWAASGRNLEAVDYFQSISDPETRKVAAGPLVRGWALTGDTQAALDLTRRFWDNQEPQDVVDGFVRGLLHAQGPAGTLAVARAVRPNEGGEFEQRLARVAMNLVSREDAQAAAELFGELEAGATDPEWLGGMLTRVNSAWRNEDPQAVLGWLPSLRASAERERALTETMGTWAIRDLDAAQVWYENDWTQRLEAAGPSSVLAKADPAIRLGLVQRLARIRPSEAAAWADAMPDPNSRARMLVRVARFWSRENLVETARWIASLDVSPTLRSELVGVANEARVPAGGARPEQG